jgi:predicted CXXCH cytochrome family protein
MAHGSGAAVDGLIEGGFTHTPSGIRYSLALRDGQAWMSYARTVAGSGPPLKGELQLSYYIGSGHRGRTYLFEREGFWFEAPVNYYGKKKLWDMAPNYESAKSMPDTLPVDSNCLHCHAGEVQAALPEARNKYAGPPFMAGGVTCAACHGDPAQHLAQQGRGSILNPAALPPARRDSVCLQCHLEGNEAIYRTGKSLAAYRPGDDLSDFVVYFVDARHMEGGGRATSQYEALLKSACKRASGDKLTCTTCHDPHGSPTAAERVSFYRAKCLACHTGEKMATEHHPEQQDCAACHMPTRGTTDISHEQLTDHNIQKRPGRDDIRPSGGAVALVPVGGVSAGDREIGLAYAQLAEGGDRSSGERALTLLRRAEGSGADDVNLHVGLGFLDQVSGQLKDAEREYEAALAEDSYQCTALANLGVLEASVGHTVQAVRLLERATEADPSQTAAGLNLAFIECKLGDKAKARQELEEIEMFNPDSPLIHQFLETGEYENQHCKVN